MGSALGRRTGLGWSLSQSGRMFRSAEGGRASRRLRAETFRRCLGLLIQTGAELQVLVGETNCLSVEALKDDIELKNGEFQVVSAGVRVHSDFIVVLQPGWEAHQPERAGFSFQAFGQPIQHPASRQPPAPDRRCLPSSQLPGASQLPCRTRQQTHQAERGNAGPGWHEVVAARIEPTGAAAGAASRAMTADTVPAHLSAYDAVVLRVLAGARAYHECRDSDSSEEDTNTLMSTR